MRFGIIFFIFFIIVIISNIGIQVKKARPKSADGGTPDKKPGWKGALEIILEEARKQMENQAKQESSGVPASRPSGWEGILSTPAPDAVPLEDMARPETIKPEAPKPEKSQKTLRQAPVVEEPVIDRPLFLARKEDEAVAAGHEMPQKFSREALRSAVVWAEILAPPLGLRNMEKY